MSLSQLLGRKIDHRTNRTKCNWSVKLRGLANDAARASYATRKGTGAERQRYSSMHLLDCNQRRAKTRAFDCKADPIQSIRRGFAMSSHLSPTSKCSYLSATSFQPIALML